MLLTVLSTSGPGFFQRELISSESVVTGTLTEVEVMEFGYKEETPVALWLAVLSHLDILTSSSLKYLDTMAFTLLLLYIVMVSFL